MGAVTIEAGGLTKRFGTRTAVTDLNFTARAGEVVGLLGPNGAGKTTTIRLLTTVLTPTSGEFRVAGIPSDRPAEIRRRVGVVPESAGYPAHQTGRDYLCFHARLFGRSRSDALRSADRLLSDVGLAERGTSRIATYSRGMRQRLGIARSLVNQPAVLFLDEPTLGLDPAGQRQVLAVVRDVADRLGTTVVLSTHALPDVEQVCSVVLVLDRGRVRVAGSTGEIARAAGLRQSGRLRVPVGRTGQATRALTQVAGLTVLASDEDSEVLTVSMTAAGDDADTALNAALQALLSAGVPVLSFAVDGTRLADAFLALTGEGKS